MLTLAMKDQQKVAKLVRTIDSSHYPIWNESFRSIYLLFSLALICSVPLQEIQKESKTYWLQKWLKNYWWRIAGGQDFRWIFIIYLWPWWQTKATRLIFYQGGCGSWIICNQAQLVISTTHPWNKEKQTCQLKVGYALPSAI